MKRPIVVGMPWYSRHDYPRILRIMKNAAGMPETYDKWKRSAEELLGLPNTDGTKFIPVVIEPDRFLRWCFERGLKPNAKAQHKFADEAAKAAWDRKH